MPPSLFCPDTTWTGTQILLSEQHCGVGPGWQDKLLIQVFVEASSVDVV